ncbi:MAG TPA: hypothetical protein PLV42_02090 [bacterium]|nr:hypothetical protein [bacterium]
MKKFFLVSLFLFGFVTAHAVGTPNIGECTRNSACTNFYCYWSSVGDADYYEWKAEVNGVSGCGTWCQMDEDDTTGTSFSTNDVFLGAYSTYWKGSVRSVAYIPIQVWNPITRTWYITWVPGEFSSWDSYPVSVVNC